MAKRDSRQDNIFDQEEKGMVYSTRTRCLYPAERRPRHLEARSAFEINGGADVRFLKHAITQFLSALMNGTTDQSRHRVLRWTRHGSRQVDHILLFLLLRKVEIWDEATFVMFLCDVPADRRKRRVGEAAFCAC